MTDNRITEWRKLAHSIASRSASPRALTDAEAALVIALREAADRCEELEKHVTGLEEMYRLSADCVKRAEQAEARCAVLEAQIQCRNELSNRAARAEAKLAVAEKALERIEWGTMVPIGVARAALAKLRGEGDMTTVEQK